MRPFVTLGDLIADLDLGVEAFPIEPGQHQTLSRLSAGPGGAGNALLAAARLGAPAAALGALGADWVGERVLAGLRAAGVDVSAVVIEPEAETTVALRLRAEAGAQVFLGKPGARGPLTLPDAWAEKLRAAGVVLVSGWAAEHDHADVILAGAQSAAAAGVPVLFDPGPRAAGLNPDWLGALLALTRVLLVTETEAAGLAAQLGAPAAAGWVSAERTVILKRGAAGCEILTPAGARAYPGFPVAARDALAAGDCFAAAVGWGLLHGYTWDVIGPLANAAGAAKVQQLGTGVAAPARAAVLAVLRHFRPDVASQLEPAPRLERVRVRRAPRCEG